MGTVAYMNSAALPQSAITLYDFLTSHGGEVTQSKAQIAEDAGISTGDLMIAEAYLSDRGLMQIDMNRLGGGSRKGRTLRVIA